MEPIGYDAYPILKWGQPYLGSKSETENGDKYDTKMVIYSALHDQNINDFYYQALYRLTDPVYVQKFMDDHRENLLFLEEQIQREYGNYKYNFDFLIENAKNIQMELQKENKQ